MAAARALGAGGTGTIVRSYRRACYLRLPGGLLALTEGSVPPGPLHLVLDGLLPQGLEPGRPARVAAGRLELACGVAVDLSCARAWVGELPAPDALRRRRRPLAGLLTASAGRSALRRGRWREPAAAACRAVAEGDLPAAAALLGGLGPGLTPAGDDALAGVLLVAKALWTPPGARGNEAIRGRDDDGCSADLVHLADGVATTEIARAFLYWAAAGQGMAHVHDFLMAGASGDLAGAARAAAEVAAVGATSGADHCFGVAAALATLPASPVSAGSASRAAGPIAGRPR